MNTRAYSLLHVKAIDAEKRVITGTATTPEPDRVGDIVEPLGVTYKNPVPLLLYHDSRQPVGSVRFSKPTADGIDFEATLPVIDEPGTLKDRVDEAWQSVKAKLLTGVSIGFRALETAFMQETGGIRFVACEVLELSLVAIPANADATIATIKSLDVERPAAPGKGSVVVRTMPGATGSSSRKTAMKTYAEQIKELENTRAAKVAEREGIQTKAADEGRTKDESEKESFKSLTNEIESIDSEIADLRVLETSSKETATAASGKSPADASASRAGVGRVEVKQTLPPGIVFARYVKCLAAARGNVQQAVEIAKHRYPDLTQIQTVLKAAVAAGTTTDPTWAGSLVEYQNFTGDFIEYLRPQTIIGKFGQGSIPALRRLPFNVRVIGQTSGGEGYWVGQGKPKPLTKFDFAPVQLGFAKVANIAVLTEELVRFSSPSADLLVRDALAAALIARMDVDFINPAKAAVADVSPASITNGITPIPSSGTDEAAVRADIKALFQAYIEANMNPANAVLIMPNTIALSLSLMVNALGQPAFPGIGMNGGTLLGLPVITSQYAVLGGSPNGNLVIMANASDIYLADDGQVVIDASREASLEMSDDPTNSSADGSPLAPVGTSLVSMFQTNSIALRAERFVNWARRREEAVAFLENVQWA